jgi:hypothetical protein
MFGKVNRASSWPARVVRYSALTFALLAMTGQVLSGLHFALVNHVTCAEHGELIETGSRVDQPTTSSTTKTIAAVAVEGHGHDHCSIALLRRQQAKSAAARPLPLRAPQPRVSLVLPATAPSAPIDPLSVAPKNSPPV